MRRRNFFQMAAARTGARTRLIESRGSMGGVWTAGLLTKFSDTRNKKGTCAKSWRIWTREFQPFSMVGAVAGIASAAGPVFINHGNQPTALWKDIARGGVQPFCLKSIRAALHPRRPLRPRQLSDLGQCGRHRRSGGPHGCSCGAQQPPAAGDAVQRTGAGNDRGAGVER